jgi:hypothetical protein
MAQTVQMGLMVADHNAHVVLAQIMVDLVGMVVVPAQVAQMPHQSAELQPQVLQVVAEVMVVPTIQVLQV